jgi:hypothetical protein
VTLRQMRFSLSISTKMDGCCMRSPLAECPKYHFTFSRNAGGFSIRAVCLSSRLPRRLSRAEYFAKASAVAARLVQKLQFRAKSLLVPCKKNAAGNLFHYIRAESCRAGPLRGNWGRLRRWNGALGGGKLSAANRR